MIKLMRKQTNLVEWIGTRAPPPSPPPSLPIAVSQRCRCVFWQVGCWDNLRLHVSSETEVPGGGPRPRVRGVPENHPHMVFGLNGSGKLFTSLCPIRFASW